MSIDRDDYKEFKDSPIRDVLNFAAGRRDIRSARDLRDMVDEELSREPAELRDAVYNVAEGLAKQRPLEAKRQANDLAYEIWKTHRDSDPLRTKDLSVPTEHIDYDAMRKGIGGESVRGRGQRGTKGRGIDRYGNRV